MVLESIWVIMPNVVIFAPYSNIWSHSVSEGRLAKALLKIGCNVTVISCGGIFPKYCTPMELYNFESVYTNTLMKSEICKNCQNNSNFLFKSNKLNYLNIANYITSAERSYALSLTQNLEFSEILDFKLDNLPIGRIALYEPLIKFKKNTFDFNSLELDFARNSLYNSILTLFALNNLFKKFSFDLGFVYSPQYSAPGVFAEKMVSLGKKVYFVEGSSSVSDRYNYLRVWDWTKYKLNGPALTIWNESLIIEREVSNFWKRRVHKHFKAIDFSISHSTYSPKNRDFQIRKFFDVPLRKKIILASLSSSDEVFSAKVIQGLNDNRIYSNVFLDQGTWIKKLIEWVAKKSEIILIVRIHPRDLANKNENVVSTQALKWSEILSSLPENVKVDHPEMKIPIESYFDQIDLLTTGWSSTALEALYRNIPVVTYDKFLSGFPDNIVISGISESDYFLNISLAIDKGIDLPWKQNVVKWLAFYFSGVVKIQGPLRDRWISDRYNLYSKLICGLERFFPNTIKFLDLHYPLSKKSLTTLHELITNELDHLFAQN